ncbi:MAG: flavin-containing monooxygenase [Solirubrobacteraceae bacterium]
MTAGREHEVVIIGAGFGGIGVAIELQRAGWGDLVLLDAAPELGGTWFWNTYPGAACDVPSHAYSYSFAQRRDWSRLCSPQDEILGYIRDVARQYGIDRLVELGTEVVSCDWDDAQGRWTVITRDGRSWSAGAVVIATGQLNQPQIPRLEGIDAFAGPMFHSARWEHSYDLRGKRIAVIGTGASAVQFVPEIAKQAAQLTVFQRSGNWFLPRKNRPYPSALKAAIQHVPGLQASRRAFLFSYAESLTAAIRNPEKWGKVVAAKSAWFMRRQLTDPEVRRKAWPDYTFGCKRVLFSSAYLPALQRPNVELVTERVARLTENGIVTEDDREREFDCVIWGTGFHTDHFMFPMEVTGAGGVSLRDLWADGAHAHLGVVVPGFPSMFMVYGPNTNTSGGSIIFYGEMQARYIRQALEEVRRRPAAAIDIRPEVEAGSDRALQARFAGTAWTRCDSWYRDEHGRIITNWPGYMREYRHALRDLDPADFNFVATVSDRAAVPAT